jgi:hypothetical protein
VWLIENELGRIRKSFFEIPFGVFWEVTTGERPRNPAEVIPRLCPMILDPEEVRCVTEFARLLPGRWEPGRQKQIALALADIFDGFYGALSKIIAGIRETSREET